MNQPSQRLVLAMQAAYYLASGGSAFAAPKLFRRLAGVEGSPLVVEENGALFTAVGAVLALGARRPHPVTEVVQLGLLVPAVTSTVIVRNRRHAPKPFAAELAAEVVFGVALAFVSRGRRRG
ncbi:MAG TPA: hypothetical protein VHE80_06090 [Acidimicrobiales bacterium]|nr:hypothetical protein [Acidimicrobiales bacterium]